MRRRGRARLRLARLQREAREHPSVEEGYRMRRRELNTSRRERWDRENAAPRLKQLVPELESLRLSLVENRGGHAIPGTRRVQHVMVNTASTLFEIPCTESACQGGGHDLTQAVGPRLRSHRSEFSGSSACTGAVGEHACERQLEYSFEAKYSGAV
jgi:hypothetical protein